MVQILQQQPSLAELLGSGVSSGLSTGLNMAMQNFINQRLQQKQMESLAKILNLGSEQQPQMTPEKITSEEIVKTPQETIVEKQRSNVEKIATNPQAMLLLAQKNPQVANQIQKMYDSQLAREKFEYQKQKEKTGFISPETQERMTDVLSRQLELIKGKNIGLASYPELLTEKGREDRAEFDTLSASIEAALLPLLNKGVLSKPRFEFLLKNIPNSTDTIGKIKGKIKALQREFKIDLPGLKEKVEVKAEEGMELTKEMAQKFLKAAKGDKDKAREMAKKSGYSF